MSQDKQEINNEGIQDRQERKETSVQRRRREKTLHHSFQKKKKYNLKQSFIFKGGLQNYMIMRKQVLKGELIKTIET